ncbi:MAG: response regulator transcription factor [Dehalococcoidia bacterium]|nr:MAG: response regulator transcription factor [Dehalococcoidia bacterium]
MAADGKGTRALIVDQRDVFRVLVVDDHEMVRSGIVSMFAGDPEIEVIGEASSAQAAIEQVRRAPPDLVLMDVRMPGMDGLAATRIIKEIAPEVSVVIVTMYADADYLFEAIKVGAAGYVLKDSTKQDLVSAVRNVLHGESSIDAGLANQLLQRLAVEPRTAPQAKQIDSLTAREREVLAHVAEGKTNAQIADALVVSRSTVKAHVEHIISKLGVSDRTQAAVRAIQLGLLDEITNN